MTCDEAFVGNFISICARIFHAVLFFEAFDLAVTEHRKSGHRNHECTHAEIFIALAELSDGGLFVGIVEEVDKALEHLRIEAQRIFYRIAVFLIFFFFEHIHERAVVDAVHTECADEVAFHHPKCFGKQQRVRNFGCDPVDDFPPKFVGNRTIEFFRRKSAFTPRRDITSVPRRGIPQPSDVFFCKHHRRIESDDRKIFRDVDDLPHHCFTCDRVQKIDLRRIVPRHAGTVVSVVDIAHVSGMVIDPLKDDGAVGFGIIMIFEVDADPPVARKILAVERVLREGAILPLDEEVGLFDDPFRIHAGVIRHHVGCKTDAALP